MLEAVREVKGLLTLSADLFIVCLPFLKESFHSHVWMGLEEFPAYTSKVILVPLTGALAEDLYAQACASFFPEKAGRL